MLIIRILCLFPNLLCVIGSVVDAARLRRARGRAQRIVAGQEEATPATLKRLVGALTSLVNAGHSSEPQRDRHLIETLGRMRQG